MNGDIRAKFLSTLPARGATARRCSAWRPPQRISIHAPREGSDVQASDELSLLKTISIHAPREGSDPMIGAFTF